MKCYSCGKKIKEDGKRYSFSSGDTEPTRWFHKNCFPFKDYFKKPKG